MLTAAKINIQLMQRGGPEGASASRAADTVDLIDRMIKHVRALSVDLRPQLMDELGLVAALREHLEAQAWRSNLKLNFVADGLPPHLPAELEIAAFRLVQEAMTNVARHAEASQVTVTLRGDDSRLIIVVRDDGRGFDLAEAARLRRTEAHIGLAGMEERTQALGGEFAIESAPGRGTTVRVALPLAG